MRFLSLFAGIGGIDLGLERAGMTCVAQVEIDPFCRRVLEKHWPDVPKFDDVRTVTRETLADVLPIDLIAGGFPCQDISHAGRMAGIGGERSGLWSEFHRLICEVRPRFVLVENVAALLERGMGTVLSELAGSGFDAEWSVLPACAMGATHMRRRVFIVAHTNGVNGRAGLGDSVARSFRPLQAFDDFARARAGALARLANPSELYRGADGVPCRMERNRAIGNTVYPAAAQWIGERIMEVASA